MITPEQKKMARAADNLDRLAEYLRKIAAEIRAEDDIAVAYAKVYYIRRNLTDVVNILGHGTPSTRQTGVRPVRVVNL